MVLLCLSQVMLLGVSRFTRRRSAESLSSPCSKQSGICVECWHCLYLTLSSLVRPTRQIASDGLARCILPRLTCRYCSVLAIINSLHNGNSTRLHYINCITHEPSWKDRLHWFALVGLLCAHKANQDEWCRCQCHWAFIASIYARNNRQQNNYLSQHCLFWPRCVGVKRLM